MKIYNARYIETRVKIDLRVNKMIKTNGETVILVAEIWQTIDD